MKHFVFSGFIVVLLALCSCTSEKRKADLSGIDFEVKINRFDQDFFNLKGTNYPVTVQELYKRYPDILPIYLNYIVDFGDLNDPETLETFPLFFADTSIVNLYSDALAAYQDVTDIEKKLTNAFRRASYFFPKLDIPAIYMHVSGLNQSVIVGDNFLSLSIDNYLGEDYPLYEKITYNYIRSNMHREKIASDYVVSFLVSEFPFIPTTGQLLENMIYRGKLLYLTSVLMPKEKEYILMGYSETQWDWCIEHEHDMWITLIEEQHLFNTDRIWITKYLQDSPFTTPFTQESPGRAGVFVGWRIVESYMKRHPEVTPLELILDLNAQRILENSGYNP